MKTMQRITALVLVLVMAAAMFSGLALSANAAATYNTGNRHTLCTSLSAQAVQYYKTNDIVWDTLCAMPGSSSGSSLKSMDSPLFKQLHSLMRETITDLGSYSGLTSLWPYTDSANGFKNVQLFYSDVTGTSYNREHVWPKSRASYYQRNGGSDVQHLRPTNTSVNSTRSNHTMGNVRELCATYSTYNGGNGKPVLYYNASYGTSFNGKLPGLVEVNDNIKGDVARIMLYVYVTWEQPNLFENVNSADLPALDSDDNEDNGVRVFENLETLLGWMQIDPVDTWEMSRNDVSQSLQGNRNVFIDYPELAWLLFNEPLPADYDTPSGYAKENGSATTYTITALSSNDAWGIVSLSGRSVTAVPATGYVVSGYTLSPENAATVTRNDNIFMLSSITADVTLTVNFAPKTAAAVTFVVPKGVTASTSRIDAYVGDTVTLPTIAGTPDDTAHTYTFVGWTDKTVTEETDLSKLNVYTGSFTLTGNTTLYALYKYTEVTGDGVPDQYVLVTADRDDWSGDYVIAGGSTNVLSATGDVTGDDLGSTSGSIDLSSTGATLTDDTISNMPTSYVYTVEKVGAGKNYTVKMHDSDNYLAWESGNSLTSAASGDADNAQWQISYTDGTVCLANAGTPSRVLYYNSGAGLFRCYTGSQSPISLYAAEGSSTTTYTTLGGVGCADGHDYVAVVTEPTCTEKGYTTHTCSRCGDSFVDTYVDALGHDWDEGKITTEPTETEAGVKTYTCKRCGETKTEEIPAGGCPSAQFTDVDTGKWYHEAVDFVVANDLMKGISDTTFEPNSPMTRGMLVTILYRAEGEPDVSGIKHPFTDVAERRYFTKPVAWAYDNDIVKGITETTFEPDTKVSREQLATILFRYAEAEAVEEDHLKEFPDAEKVHNYAKTALNWAVAEGLITGNKTGDIVNLDPRESATRAQIATILMRYMQNAE